jgi:hypothetical protein
VDVACGPSLRSYACGCNFESKERFLLRAIGRTPVMANTVSAAHHQLAKKLQLLGNQLATEKIDACRVAAR